MGHPSELSSHVGNATNEEMDMEKCGLCGRTLSVDGDRLSTDCGGDCWGCIGLIEAEHGDVESKIKVALEIERGVRSPMSGT